MFYFVATLCLILQHSPLSWVGLGPCADVGLIPLTCGLLLQNFSLNKVSQCVGHLYLANFSIFIVPQKKFLMSHV